MYTYGDEAFYSKVVEFENNKTGFNQFVKWSHKEADKESLCHYLMEATGVYYELLAAHLHKIGLTVYVVLPNKAKDFARYQGIWTKNDIIDSKFLALFGCKEWRLKLWSPPLPIYKKLRTMCRFNADAKKLRTMLMNHLEALKNSDTPEKTVVKHYEILIKGIDKRLKDNEKNIRVNVESNKELFQRVEQLESIKGIGYATIVTVIAETQGFEFITNRKQLTSFAGLDIVENQSGTITRKTKISKRGNARIRAALYFPAIVAALHNKALKEDYQRIVAKNSKQKKVAITAIQRKLLLLIYSLWKSGQTYEER
jgi:transposase